MADFSIPRTPLSNRLHKAYEFSRFAYATLIAPWPPFIFYLVGIAALGALSQWFQVRITTNLINDLIRQLQDTSIIIPSSLIATLQPYFSEILLLVGMQTINWLTNGLTFQNYLAALQNEHVREHFDAKFLRKALALRLERFEKPEYYDAMERATWAMRGFWVPQQLAEFQRLVALVASNIGALWALAGVHWAIPLALLPGSLLLIRWYLQSQRESDEIEYVQTPRQRRQQYWRNLLTQRGPAAEVRLFGLGHHIVESWRKLTDEVLTERLDVRQRQIRRGGLNSLVNIGLYALVLTLIIRFAVSGTVSVGTVVAFLFALQQYMDYLNYIAVRLRWHESFLTALSYAPTFLASEGEEAKTGGRAPFPLKDGIRFEQVSFTYPGSDHPSLKDIDFTIRPGQRIAIVGENGAGKSTLVKLLLGLYQPTTGRILVDSIDLRDILPQDWRAHLAAVLQDFVHYSFTIRENIGLGDLARMNDLPALGEAARLSGAETLIEKLPQTYETLLGKEFEGGYELSQGQWQKVALARAYVRQAEVLVLDEPTAALDALAELEVYRQFARLGTGKTVLLISHRLGSARLADRIIFIQQGQIVQTGTHDELLSSGGPYADLYALQAEWYQPIEKDQAHQASQ